MPAVHIEVTFLAGRYHGQEWPPSPLRLFQALVAGVMTGGHREFRGAAEPALAWMERQQAPLVIAEDATALTQYRISAPNNDFDIAAKEWRSGKSYDAAKLRTMKTVSPRAVSGESGHLHYLWAAAELPEAAVLDGLRGVARRMHTLGWGIDMACADAGVLEDAEIEELRGTRWIPGERGGSVLTLPSAGTLADLDATYERYTRRAAGKGVNPNTRVSVFRFQNYRRGEAQTRPRAEFRLRMPLKGTKELPHPEWHECMAVAARLRHASGSAMREEKSDPAWVDSYIMGHTPPGEEGRRLSYVPVPSIGHPNSDGRIRRAMILEPPGGAGDAVDLLRVKLAGGMLQEDGRTVAFLEGRDDRDVVWPFYLRESEEWHTVTPVVLHGFNTDRGQLSLRKTERLLLQAVCEAGYPDGLIEEMSFQAAPYWGGAEGATRLRVPQHLDGRPRYHVALRFTKPVAGPVVAGIGRHYGIGLFAARRRWEGRNCGEEE